MRLYFENGNIYNCVDDVPFIDRGDAVVVGVRGNLVDIASDLKCSSPVSVSWESESGEEIKSLAEFPCVDRVMCRPTEGTIFVTLRKRSPLELAEGELTELVKEQAVNLSDTRVVALERFISEWTPGVQQKDSLVRRSSVNQVYRVLQAHDSTGNPTWTPEECPALFSVCHTTDPAKAKPWVEPFGTSGMYKLNECYLDESDGSVYRQTFPGDNVYNAKALPERWKKV